jgi:hypothetical protein
MIHSANNKVSHQIKKVDKDEIKSTECTRKVLKDCYKICPKCGNFTNYLDKNKYCHICGSVFIEQCPECKEPIIYPNSRFCPMCGKDF